MLPTQKDFKRTGTLGGQEVKMTFDENSLNFLADVLINLYSDKELACIREYSTNARDSHKEAGQTRPIEVTTPTPFSMFLKVKDWGIGLSTDDIVNIYSKYGASTARNSNDKTGMLGLGSKAALTYTNQFNIVAVKNGVKINVAVSRDIDGGGGMTILSETETNEHNGVEIIIPVNRNNNFQVKAFKFFRFWDVSEVLIDGQPPGSPDLIKVTDRVHLIANADYYEKSFVVMGGVSYEIDPGECKLPRGFIAFADMGDVHFTPSREYLHYTQQTKTKLEEYRQECRDNINKRAQEDIEHADSKVKAVDSFERWYQIFRDYGFQISATDFKYKGEDLKRQFEFDARYVYGDALSHKSDGWRMRNVHGYDVKRSTVIEGFTADKVTSYQKRKLKQWADDNNVQAKFYFCDKSPIDGWLDVRVIQWSDILAVKLVNANPAGPRPKEKPGYDLYINNSFKTVEDIDKTLPIWYGTKTDFNKHTGDMHYRAEVFKDIQFVFIGVNRLKKFLAAYPKAVSMTDALDKFTDDYVDNLSDKDKSYIASDQFQMSRLAMLDATKLLDPDLVKMVELADNKTDISTARNHWNDMVNLAYKLNKWGFNGKIKQEGKTDWIYEKYPLFGRVVGQRPYGSPEKLYDEHVHIYLNAAYEQIEGV